MAIALSGSLVITGSIFATQGITGSFSGSATSASYADTLQGLGSASFAPAATFNTVSQSFAITSGSLSTRVTNLESTSSTVSSSFASTSGSLSTRVTNLESTSSIVSSSFATTSGSIAGRATLIEGQYATTGSNTFTGPQYVSQASNAISFTSTASLYTDGGLRVSKDSFVSGTAYFNNVVVYGTSSIQYITSSQVNFGTNIITVNTDTPAVRFGGLAVFDSGSTQLTGSMLWDSEKNHWIYSNPSGSTYNSAMLMNGPRNTGSLGTEQGTLSNYVMKGQGGDHITSSQIIDDGTTVQIPGNLQVTGSLSGSSAVFSSALTTSNITTRLANGIILTRDNGSTQVEVNIRHTSTRNGVFSFTEDGVADRWAIGTKPSDGTLYFSANFDLLTPRFTLSSAGVATFSSTIAGTTIYGSTAVCSPVGKFTSCIDAGSGIFSGNLTVNNTITAAQSTAEVASIVATSGWSGTVNNPIITFGRLALAVAGQIGYDDPNTRLYIGTTTNHDLTIRTNNTDRLLISSAGVACFSSTVCAPSFVGGTLSGTSATISNAGTACTVTDVLTLTTLQTGSSSVCAGAGILFTGNGGGTVARIYSRGNMNFNNGSDLVFQTQVSAGGTPQCTMVINGNSQNVGIGTFTPGTKLEILSKAADADRTIPHNVLTLTAEQGNAPYGFFGGAILFKNRSYTSGLVESARIRSVIYDDGAPANCGGGLWFETTPTPGGTLTPSLKIDYAGIACFSNTVCASAFLSSGAITTNANFINSGPVYSTTGNVGNILFTNLYPSTYNVAQIASVLDGYYYASKLVFRTADQFNANLLVDRLTITSLGAATFSNSITNSGNLITYKAGGSGTAKQVVVGQTTAAASGVAKKIAYVGYTHSVRVYVWANQSAANGSSAIADITTLYGASSGGTTAESSFGTTSDIVVTYDNGGSPAYTINVTLTYSGAAPTINYVVEGISHDNNIYTIA